MVAGGDSQTGVEVVDDGPHGGLELKGHPVGGNSDFKVSQLSFFF